MGLCTRVITTKHTHLLRLCSFQLAPSFVWGRESHHQWHLWNGSSCRTVHGIVCMPSVLLTRVSAVSSAPFARGAFLLDRKRRCRFPLPFVLVSPWTPAHTHVHSGDSHATVHTRIAVQVNFITRSCCIQFTLTHPCTVQPSLLGLFR